MSALINPALIKETTGSNATGPLQMYAANYSLWKLKFITIRLTPLVGGSAVSGTVIRVSLNMSGQPGSPNWSALGARRHRDTNPGKPLVMRVPGSAMLGPKEGWFLCNTKNDPQMCLGGSIEIHSLGKTKSTYQAKDYDGPLFLAEITGEWHFKNYNPEPGMLNLVKESIQEEPQNIKIHTKTGEPILMSIPNDSAMARAIGQVDVNADATASEIIWQICDAAVTTATAIVAPPFSWLFSAGWWFIKRIANKKQNGIDVPGEPNPGELTFMVYQSMNDAQNDVPCIATGNTMTTNTTLNKLQLLQITPGNTGLQQETLAGLRRTIEPTHDPVQVSSRSQVGQRVLFGHIYDNLAPLNCISLQAVGAQTRVYTYSVRELLDPIFVQNGVTIQPDQIDLPGYPIQSKVAEKYTTIGNVYLAAYCKILNSVPVHWTTVCWKAITTTQIRLQRADANKKDKFIFFQPTQSVGHAVLPETTYMLKVSAEQSLAQQHIEIQKDKWYMSSFVAVGEQSAPDFSNYGVNFYVSKTITVPEGEYQPIEGAYNVGAMLNTATPLVLNLNVNRTQDLTSAEVTQLRQLLAGAGPPSQQLPMIPDYHDIPTLEGEGEEILEAAGDSEIQQDIKNWVEYGHRKRPPTPFSPIEEGEEEEEESDLDDDDYAEVPSYIKNLLTPEAKKLFDDLKRMGLSHEKAVKAAQGAYPHPAVEIWEEAYHNALVDGLSPPSARDCAWGAVSDYLP